jgi:hypothetical protein
MTVSLRKTDTTISNALRPMWEGGMFDASTDCHSVEVFCPEDLSPCFGGTNHEGCAQCGQSGGECPLG